MMSTDQTVLKGADLGVRVDAGHFADEGRQELGLREVELDSHIADLFDQTVRCSVHKRTPRVFRVRDVPVHWVCQLEANKSCLHKVSSLK